MLFLQILHFPLIICLFLIWIISWINVSIPLLSIIPLETGEPSYNEYLIDMILKTLSRPQLKLITVKVYPLPFGDLSRLVFGYCDISCEMWKPFFPSMLRLLIICIPPSSLFYSSSMASYTISVYNNISPVYNNLLSIYLLSLYNVYTMRVDLKVECQQVVFFSFLLFNSVFICFLLFMMTPSPWSLRIVFVMILLCIYNNVSRYVFKILYLNS